MKRSAHPKGRGRREAAAESNVSAHFESGTGVPPVSRASVPLAFPQIHAWGLDLSGTKTGAGGVGGLLFEKLHATPGAPILAPCYDGNGNILACVDCATGQTLARYEYDPFGKLLLKEEDTRVAGRLHHQFSTKYTDEETGLSYYGYRYYDPVNGRWMSADPIGIEGGLNLYAMVGNDPVNQIDYLGNDGFAPPGWWSRLMNTEYLPGSSIPRSCNPYTMAVTLQAVIERFPPWSAGFGQDNCKKWKHGYVEGDMNHCLFGCLMSLNDPLTGLVCGCSEGGGDFEWNDLSSDYVGYALGITATSVSDCVRRCRSEMCAE